jgi:DNA-binding transcriptional regulator YiaG
MPNIGSFLKEEISRLCRRELRRETAMLKRASVVYRHDIAALKREVAALTRQIAMLAKRAPSTPEAPTNDKPIRFVAKGLPSLRKRLGLSALQLARLLNVSEQSVYNWESKKTTPRKEQVAAIAALRSVGKREAVTRLEQLSAKPSPKEKPPVRSKRVALERKRTIRGKHK